jgi:HAD superfamily hydrolase (TIGR01509 family)
LHCTAKQYLDSRNPPRKPDDDRVTRPTSGGPVIIFDCNGVLVDSEQIAAAVLADSFKHAGVTTSADTVMRRFHGRRPADIFVAVEAATGRKLPSDFSVTVGLETLRRLRKELRPIPHAAHALTWLRGPKAVASSSPPDRMRLSLEVTGLLRFFEPRLFSASDVRHGKPAPDLFLIAAERCQVQPADCIVVEDSAPGIAAAAAAGMTPIGFVGGNHAAGRLVSDLRAAGARTVIADMRALKSTINDLRGW